MCYAKLAETMCRYVPGSKMYNPWLKNVCGHLLCDRAHLCQCLQFAQANQLHQRISVRCRLVGSGDHRHAKRVGQPLVEPGVACTTAEHMHPGYGSSRDLADLMKNLAVT